MVIRKQKKSRKFRGSRRHGFGFSKQHQGKGHRGGAGRAGSGKRGQQKMTLFYSKGIRPLGRVGMLVERRNKPEEKTITIRDLDQRLETWQAQGLVQKEKDTFVVDLKKLGYDKLLSSGKLTHKIKLSGVLSEEAKKKVETFGGIISR